MKKNQKASGFTLLELLIAISISSAIILSIYSAFYTGILSSNKIDASFEAYQSARTILNRIELDLRNSFPYYKSSNDNSRFRGARGELSFYSIVDYFSGDESFLRVCRIEYRLEGAPVAPVLRRYVFKGLDALKDDVAVEPEELSVNIKEIVFRYRYPPPAGMPVTTDPFPLQDTWPEENNPEQLKDLPFALDITLILKQKERNRPATEVAFTKTVVLPLCSKNSKKP